VGGDAVANYDNVTTMGGGENTIKTALDTCGRVDILINNRHSQDKTIIKTKEGFELYKYKIGFLDIF